jgi:putative toxin-antitoxin system antitoxin component (TIGR02293 family)
MSGVQNAAGRDALSRGAVVLEGARRAADLMGLSQTQLARVLGMDASTLSRRLTGRRGLDERSREYEAAVLWIRLFRSLHAVVGGQDGTARAWLASPNTAFGGLRPRDLIESSEGLVRVVQYLDAHRATL